MCVGAEFVKLIATGDTNPLAQDYLVWANIELGNFMTYKNDELIVLGFNDMSTLVGHFVSSPREREKKRQRR